MGSGTGTGREQAGCGPGRAAGGWPPCWESACSHADHPCLCSSWSLARGYPGEWLQSTAAWQPRPIGDHRWPSLGGSQIPWVFWGQPSGDGLCLGAGEPFQATSPWLGSLGLQGNSGEKGPQGPVAQPPALSRVSYGVRAASSRALSSLALKTPKDGDCTAPLGSLRPCLATYSLSHCGLGRWRRTRRLLLPRLPRRGWS